MALDLMAHMVPDLMAQARVGMTKLDLIAQARVGMTKVDLMAQAGIGTTRLADQKIH